MRGLQKKMIVVRTHDSRLFEEAYFVMRKDGASPADSSRDMLAEADRIISGTLSDKTEPSPHRKKTPWWQKVLWLGAGILCGSGITVLLRFLG